jgi:hypothetical protein
MRSSLLRGLLAAGSLWLAACGGVDAASESADTTAVTHAPELVQMNDVSVMFPLGEDDASLLSADADGRGGEVLPRQVYESAFGPPGTLQTGGTPAAPPHDALRLVSFRVDPCFAQIGAIADHDACDNQLRLVFQSTRDKADGLHAEDNAVHAFYRLSRSELTQAVEALVAWRLEHGDERLGPLAPHPLLTDGQEAVAAHKVVTSLAGPASLMRITLFTTSGLGTAWNFSGFDVVEGEVARMPMVDLPASTEVVAFFRGFTPGELTGDPAFTPPTEAEPANDMQLLGNAMRALAASADEQQRAVDAAARIESPDFHSPDTTDCASCHAAEPARRMVGEALLGLSASDAAPRSLPDLRFLHPDDLAATSVDPEVNLHMFSYTGRQASIHGRTIDETASVVAYLNEHVFGFGD